MLTRLSPTGPAPLVLLSVMQKQMEPQMPPAEDVKRRLLETSLAFASDHGLVRGPWLQTYTERLPGRGGVLLSLSRWPVVEVLSLEVCGEPVEVVEVVQERRDTLFYADGWPVSRTVRNASPGTGDRELDVTVTYRAGWLVPDQVHIWELGVAVAASTWVAAQGGYFEAATSGETGSQEPEWAEMAGDVLDGDVTWRRFPAEEVPLDLQAAAVLHTRELLNGHHAPPPHVHRVTDSGGSVTLKDTGSFSPGVRAILERYR